MHMVEERPRREFSLGRQQVLGPGCPVALCRSCPSSRLALPVLPVDVFAVCGSPEVSAVACHPVLPRSSLSGA